MNALSAYDLVFSPRRANIPDLEALKGPQVHYLPFAFSPDVHHPVASDSPQSGNVVFIGGADPDRVRLMTVIHQAGLPLDLWGGYWSRQPALAPLAHGHAGPEDFPALVTNAAVNLCLVRRANRDGHSMRTFELAAIGGCMAVEDTREHRELFGPDDQLVRYFASDADLVALLTRLLGSPQDRHRLAAAVREQFFDQPGHRYSDRLQSMIEVAKSATFGHSPFLS
jgi:spore maturation protein CgeB